MGARERRAPGAARPHGAAGAGGSTSRRLTYVDNLKVVLIAAIIVFHAILGYAGLVEVWTYSEVREVTLSPAVEITLFVLVSPFGFFLIALFFLVAGLLTPPSLERKGTRRFVTDRLVRLGVPFVLYVFLVQPSLVYLLLRAVRDDHVSYWEEYAGEGGQVDTGPLWFVGVLLLYSLGYAGWRAWRDRAGAVGVRRADAGPLTPRTLALAAAVVAATSYVIRLVYPYGSESGISDLNLWEWPACIAAFAIGVAGSRRDWLAAVPPGMARVSRAASLAGVGGMIVLLLVVGAVDAVDDAMGGWRWLGVPFVTLEAVLTVFGPVWLLGVSQRRLDRPFRAGPALSRSAYGAFMLQTVFLLALAVALRTVPVPAEVKALLVAFGGVTASFAAAWLLVTRVPGVSRVL